MILSRRFIEEKGEQNHWEIEKNNDLSLSKNKYIIL